MSSTAEMLTRDEVFPVTESTPAEPEEGSDLPLTVIERRPGWQLVNLGELWRYRELLFFLTWRDVKVRYKQTVLGAVWAVLQPLATMAVFSLFLGRIASQPDAAVPYPLFIFAGLLPWGLFAGSVSAAGTSVVGNSNLITKVYFPRLMIPLSAIGVSVVDFALGGAVLIVFMAAYGVAPTWGLLLAPVILLVLLMTAAGLGILLAALTVAFRDFRYVIPFMIQLGMFATPAIFLQNSDILGPKAQALLPIVNPLHGLIVNFRAALLGGPFDLPALACASVWAVALLGLGCLYFRRVERSFADII